MMKKFAFTLLALATVLAITPCAKADPIITGSIGVGGSSDTWTSSSITFDNTLGDAKVVDSGSTTGSLTAVINDDVTFDTNPLKFATADGTEMFSTGDGVTLTIVSITKDFDSSLGLLLNGTGWLTQDGHTTTLVDWSLSSTKTGDSTTFGVDASTGNVPEPSSLLLLGTGLLGLAIVLYRKVRPSGLVLHT
jgi:hypothetical protein